MAPFPSTLSTLPGHYAQSPAATPDPHKFTVEYTPKIQLKLKRGPSGGGCG